MAVLLECSVGELVIDLLIEECPITTKNFLKLCKMKYYNGCLFYNVQQNYICQTGDPTGTGKGGKSIYGFLNGNQADAFEDEISKQKKMNKVGLVCMAHDQTKENANQSQFFITLRGEDLDNLDGKYTIFGEIAEGLEVLQKLNELYCDGDGRPYQDVRIKHTYILDDPFPDPLGMDNLVPPSSPERNIPCEEKVRKRIPYEEGVATEVDSRTEAELEQSIRSKEAKSRAIVLEMTGDIPDADVKPPDEVLFVCKLNNITTDADLELIFSRFGTIKQCEIIRDFKTGDSLCYAFIEFETAESCIEAYEKMNNVLIDDRRIKVDFSQSVSQLWNRFLSKPRDNKKKGGMQQQNQKPFQPQIKKPQLKQQQPSHYESHPTDKFKQDSKRNLSESVRQVDSKVNHKDHRSNKALSLQDNVNSRQRSRSRHSRSRERNKYRDGRNDYSGRERDEDRRGNERDDRRGRDDRKGSDRGRDSRSDRRDSRDRESRRDRSTDRDKLRDRSKDRQRHRDRSRDSYKSSRSKRSRS